MAMSRSSSWREHRLADRLEVNGSVYRVDMVARKATGVEGWRMSLVYLPADSVAEVNVDLPNATSTADVRRVVRELGSADDSLGDLLRRHLAGS
jgi:hypothetical protein